MKTNIWNTYSSDQLAELNEINEKYKSCLNAGKTERECVELSIRMAEAAGYRSIEEVLAAGDKLKAGGQGICGEHEQDACAFPHRRGAALRRE